MGEHLNPPPLVQGSLKETLIDTFNAFVKDAAEMYAVGEIVSAVKGQQSQKLQCLNSQGTV